jgi:hypothetical protein
MRSHLDYYRDFNNTLTLTCTDHITQYEQLSVEIDLNDLDVEYASRRINYINTLVELLIKSKSFANISGRVKAEYMRVEQIVNDYIRIIQALVTLTQSPGRVSKTFLGLYLLVIPDISDRFLYKIKNKCQYLRANEPMYLNISSLDVFKSRHNVEIMLNYLAVFEEGCRRNKCQLLPQNDNIKLQDIMFIDGIMKNVAVNVEDITYQQKLYMYCLYTLSLENSGALTHFGVHQYCIEQFERMVDVNKMYESIIQNKIIYNEFMPQDAILPKTFKELITYNWLNNNRFDDVVKDYLKEDI